MPYKINRRFHTQLPAAEKARFTSVEQIGEHFFNKQSGKCSLCEDAMAKPSEDLVLDHDIPEARGGKIKLSNLQLTHHICNSFKRDRTTSEIKPFCKFRRYIEKSRGPHQYGDVIEHFGIELKPSSVEIKKSNVEWAFPDGTSGKSAISKDESTERKSSYDFTYIEIPRAALWNDRDVQPRDLFLNQVFLIYQDLLQNPLHEPPSCRLGPEGSDGMREILMFDGQHKTIAYWLHGNERIVVKAYLDLDRERATHLVNSIQSKIGKLPLTPFEIASKMTQEVADKLIKYVEDCMNSGATASEKGFVESIDAQEKQRCVAGLRDSFFQAVLDHPGFRMKEFVVKRRNKKVLLATLTENMLRKKLIDPLLWRNPLDIPLDDGKEARDEETRNIVWLTNEIVDRLVDPVPGGANGKLTQAQVTARERLCRQPSLLHVAACLLKLYQRETTADGGMFIPLTDAHKANISVQLSKFCDHPAWTSDWATNSQMTALKDALDKNQGVEAAFAGVALTWGYAVLGDGDANYMRIWRD